MRFDAKSTALIVTIGILVCGCATGPMKSAPTRTVAYVSWEGKFVLVTAKDRSLAAEAIEAKILSDRSWVVQTPSGETVPLEVLEVPAIPSELADRAILATAPPLGRMRCVITAPARQECKNLGDSSAYIWYHPVRECQAGGLTDQCTPLVNKPINHFDLYRTPDCSGTPVRRQIVTPGDSCK